MLKTHYMDIIKNNILSNRLVITLLGSMAIALSSLISIPLPFSPIPLTGQTLAIMSLGLMFGSRQAAASTILYLLECAVGLPPLLGGLSSPLVLIGVNGGYFFSMPIMAYISGMTNAKKSLSHNIFFLSLASLVVLGIGSLYLSLFVGFQNAPMMGFYPFVPAEGLKIVLLSLSMSARRYFE